VAVIAEVDGYIGDILAISFVTSFVTGKDYSKTPGLHCIGNSLYMLSSQVGETGSV